MKIRRSRSFVGTFVLLMIGAAVGTVHGYSECLKKVQAKYGEYIPDKEIEVPVGKDRFGLGIANPKPDVSEDNGD